jgi:hypothetical protein
MSPGWDQLVSNLGPIWVDFSPHGPHLSRFGNHLGTNSFKLGPDNRYAGSCGGASHPRKHATPNVALKKTGGGRGGEEGVGGACVVEQFFHEPDISAYMSRLALFRQPVPRAPPPVRAPNSRKGLYAPSGQWWLFDQCATR